jgi:hypothetical protein
VQNFDVKLNLFIMSKTKIQVKSIYGLVLFEYEKEDNTVMDTVIDAVKKHANLRYADLSGAHLSGADLSGAHLRGADLRDADLSGANLRYADLSGADLSDAHLRYADLRGADLSDAHLSGADLSDAHLRYADLSGANLRYADLSGADLSGAHLRGADLRDADLRGANLRYADLSGADLSDAHLSEGTFGITINCPEEGAFIAFKKCNGKVVKLLIPEDAKRSSATTYKCRASKATCLEIEGGLTEIASDRDADFIYRVGETIEVSDFDDNRWKECSTGIHFFINQKMAKQYE